MMDGGYIKLYRKIVNDPMWNKSKIKSDMEAWIDILLWASWSDRETFFQGKYHKLKRGEIITSLRSLRDRWGWKSTKRVKTYLRTLSELDRIIVKMETQWTHITVCNYDSYQSPGNTKETVRKQSGNSEETRDNKGKKLKNIIPPTPLMVKDYMTEIGANGIAGSESVKFWDFYESKNWLIGKSKMKDWEAAARNWVRRNKDESKEPPKVKKYRGD